MGSSVTILRSFRIFRIFALISRLKSLKALFTAVASSLPKMASVRHDVFWIRLLGDSVRSMLTDSCRSLSARYGWSFQCFSTSSVSYTLTCMRISMTVGVPLHGYHNKILHVLTILSCSLRLRGISGLGLFWKHVLVSIGAPFGNAQYSSRLTPLLRTGPLARSSHSSRLWPWVSSPLPETRTRAFVSTSYLSVSDSWTGVVRQVMAARPFAFVGFFFFVMTSAFVGKFHLRRSKLELQPMCSDMARYNKHYQSWTWWLLLCANH
jgi:hypothetical protein